MEIRAIIREATRSLKGNRVVINSKGHDRHGQVGVVMRSHGDQHEVHFKKGSATFSTGELKDFPRKSHEPVSNITWID